MVFVFAVFCVLILKFEFKLSSFAFGNDLQSFACEVKFAFAAKAVACGRRVGSKSNFDFRTFNLLLRAVLPLPIAGRQLPVGSYLLLRGGSE